MRQIVLTLILVLIGSAPAWAGNSNPDQLDVYDSFYSTSPRDAATNTAYIILGGSGGRANSARGDLHNHNASSTEGATIFWNLYEPDMVSRRPERGKQSQGSYIRIGFSTWDSSGTTWDSTIVERCKAATRVRAGDPDEASWRVSCKRAFDAMGLSQGEMDRLDTLLGRYVNTRRDSIGFTGHGPEEDD